MVAGVVVCLDVAEELVVGEGVVEVVNNGVVVMVFFVPGVGVVAGTDRVVELVGFEVLRVVVAGGVCCDISR